VQRDPIGLNGGINVFGYVGGGPVGGVDPEGLRWPTIVCEVITRGLKHAAKKTNDGIDEVYNNNKRANDRAKRHAEEACTVAYVGNDYAQGDDDLCKYLECMRTASDRHQKYAEENENWRNKNRREGKPIPCSAPGIPKRIPKLRRYL
jgi:uncharacterized protein RhaS with RHS repeats